MRNDHAQVFERGGYKSVASKSRHVNEKGKLEDENVDKMLRDSI